VTDPSISEQHITVQRTARYFTLGGSDDRGREIRDLWIVCHGYGQLAASFLRAFTPIATPSRRIVAPEGLSRFYLDSNRKAANPDPRIGASWMTREDREHEIADQIAYLDAVHDHVRAALEPSVVRLRVLGFSQGVATVARWLAYGRARADDVIFWAGSFPAEIELAPFAARLNGAAVVLVSGERDELASWAAADTQLVRFTTAGISARLMTFPGGHRLDSGTLVALAGGDPVPDGGRRAPNGA